MDALKRLALLATVALLAVSMVAGPAAAQEDPAEEAPAEEPDDEPAVEEPADDDGDHRVAIAASPRDRLGLILLGSLILAGVAALINARRQLKGERPQASGDFRWR